MMLRLGIIGTGRIAKRAVKEISFVEGIAVFAVYNPHQDHAKEFLDAVKTDIAVDAQAVGDFDKFLGHVDAVYVASPHGSHYDYAKRALKAGKHLICEKPMALSKTECRELFSLAEEKNLVLIEAIKTEFAPGFKRIIEVAESGTIGEIVDVEAAFTRLTTGDCREFTDKEHGGAFTEFGSYCLLPIIKLLGCDYQEVKFYITKTESGVDGYTKAVFEFDRGFGTAKCGLTVKSEGQLLISGTQGYILVPSPWWLTKYFEVRYEDPGRIERYECEFEGDGLRYEFKEFVRRVESLLNGDGNGRSVNSQKKEAVARAGVFEEKCGM